MPKARRKYPKLPSFIYLTDLYEYLESCLGMVDVALANSYPSGSEEVLLLPKSRLFD
jgi:hypothetical protein